MKKTKTTSTVRDSVPFSDVNMKRKPVPKTVEGLAKAIGALRGFVGQTKK